MKVLLIGKNGQIGREIYNLGKEKHKIFATSKSDLDITSPAQVKKAIDTIKPEIVINGSGYHVVSDCETYPDKAFELNTFAVKNLIEICSRKKVRLINFSTDKVFDGTKKSAYTEEDKTNPLQVYGVSKLAGEVVAHTYSDNSLTIRTCGVYGGTEGSRIKKGNFVLMIVKESKNKKKLEISSEQVASFVNATDLASITLKLIDKGAGSGIYHVVNEGYASWAQFAAEIVKIARLPLDIVPVDRSGSFSSVKIPIFAGLSVNKVKNEGIRVDPWRDGLSRYIDFLKKENAL